MVRGKKDTKAKYIFFKSSMKLFFHVSPATNTAGHMPVSPQTMMEMNPLHS